MSISISSVIRVPAFLIAMSMIAHAGPTQDKAKQDKVLYNGALAQAYAEKCKALKVSWVTYAMMLDTAGIDVDTLEKGPGLQRMVREMERAAAALAKTNTKDICGEAKLAFGPKGQLVPGLLSDGMAAKAQNKLFDWLYKKGF